MLMIFLPALGRVLCSNWWIVVFKFNFIMFCCLFFFSPFRLRAYPFVVYSLLLLQCGKYETPSEFRSDRIYRIRWTFFRFLSFVFRLKSKKFCICIIIRRRRKTLKSSLLVTSNASRSLRRIIPFADNNWRTHCDAKRAFLGQKDSIFIENILFFCFYEWSVGMFGSTARRYF